MNSAKTGNKIAIEVWRSRLILVSIMAAMMVLVCRAVWVQLVNNEFLIGRGEARYAKQLTISAPRGKIYDRNMVVLASNVPAQAIWIIPEEVQEGKMTATQEARLTVLLEIGAADLRKKIAKDDKRFVYLRRQVSQEDADKIKALNIKGVYTLKEVKRDYPQGEVFAHLTGFTDIEGKGQDGIERVKDKTIEGTEGSRRVIRDRLGNVLEDEGIIKAANPGEDVVLSLDARVQYIAFNALRDVVDLKGAKSASAMVVDTQTGEVLAMANYPAYDPNKRSGMTGDQVRNRTVTDLFEPGSTLKPFSTALALEEKLVSANTVIDTQGG